MQAQPCRELTRRNQPSDSLRFRAAKVAAKSSSDGRGFAARFGIILTVQKEPAKPHEGMQLRRCASVERRGKPKRQTALWPHQFNIIRKVAAHFVDAREEF